MQLPYILFWLFIFSFLPASAQIQLKVVNAETGQPLDSVVVLHLESKESVVTNELGRAALEWPAPARIQLFKPSFKSSIFTAGTAGEEYLMELIPLRVQLREVVVQAFEQNRPLEEVPGSIHRLSSSEIGRFDQTSLLPAVNVIPGVRLEERSPGSYRVSIRGSSIRAPFGVRNVKVYWNGIPLTEPGGDTQLNFLDLVNIDQLEVIKGPAGSLYGAGTGGALLLESETEAKESEAGYLMGSYGLHRAYAKIQVGNEKSAYGLRVAHQESDGYREHTAFERQVAQLSTEHELDENRQLSTHLLYTNLFYEIPGGLNPEQYQENPRQARPGSEERNASINYDVLMGALTHDMEFGNWSNQTTLYSYLHYFDHPFNTDYKKQSTLAGGGRTLFQYLFNWGNMNSTLTAGAEYQLQYRSAQNFGNRGGIPDTLNFSDEITSGQHLLFAQADLEIPDGWFLTGGLSYNRLRYTINRLFDAREEGFLGTVDTRFQPDFAARIGLVKEINPALNLHASMSQGFSPPGLDEFLTNEGSINTALEPERGTNYELGIRGKILKNRLYYDLTAFHFRLDQTIVSYEDASTSVILFRNAGATRQNGIELWADYLLLQTQNFLRQLRIRQSYTYHHFLFEDYVQRDQDFSGNRIPGVAPHSLASSLMLETSPGINLQADWQYVDAIPLNDENSFYAEAYNVLRLKLAYELPLRGFAAEFFAGADNLLNRVYSLGNDINPYGKRYFQPAAGRSIFAGIRIQW